ncbi:MAG: hypothetical protein L6R28_18290 [Planctomycetes bacterium]|nr:hypothetical protein [Planctomycetota bacterium]
MHKAIAPGGPYRFAWLTQKCMMCDWKETTHGIELELCPKCGAPVDPKRTLQSGVLRIEMAHKKNRFYVHEHERRVTLYDPDIPDLLKFLLNNYEDWTGEIISPNPVQQMIYQANQGGLVFNRQLSPDEYGEELVQFTEEMKGFYSGQLNRIWCAVQELAGFVSMNSGTQMQQMRGRLALAATCLKGGRFEEAQAVLAEVQKALGG